jgi:tetratricopeptide (TPR) repeat protein
MKLTSMFVIPLALGMVIAVAGCQTEPKVIPTDLSAAESFQRAQDAADNGNYSLAIRYYRTFRENNPTNADRDIWALYEIAFNYHKMGKNATAMTFLDQLLQQYQNNTGTLPPAPRILAQDLKDRLSPLVAAAPAKAAAADPAAVPPAPAPSAPPAAAAAPPAPADTPPAPANPAP